MATMYGGDDKQPIKVSKKSCNPGSADCADGQRPSTKTGRSFFSKFNPTKKRYNLPQGKPKPKPDEQPTNETHMNVRNLGGESGQPMTTTDQGTNVAERKKAEIKLSKARKYFGRK